MTVTELELRITEGGKELRVVRLDTAASVVLGRDPGATVVLDSRRISRRHVTLTRVQEGVRVVDSSANGTVAGGVLLRRTGITLPTPFVVELGDCTLEVRGDGARGSDGVTALRKKIRAELVEHLDIGRLEARGRSRDPLRAVTDSATDDVTRALRLLVDRVAGELPASLSASELMVELRDEVLGLGPLEPLLADESVSEVMVVDPGTIFVERGGRIERTTLAFTDAEAVRAVIERIVTPLGRRLDESVPVVDARLPDGSRVHAIIPPLAVRGPCITIRKFQKSPLSLADLVRLGALPERVGAFLERAVRARQNIVISGGTGSGKTTLLNALSAAIPEGERILTIEDAAELRLSQPHVVALESRVANAEGKGAYGIRELVKNALRMRPDRIVVGECRGGEALDMLQAMNTGHEGSMTTTHASSPRRAIARLETLCLMAGLDLPLGAIRAQIASSVHLVVQQARLPDGRRRVTSVAEVVGVSDEDGGEVQVAEIYARPRGIDGTDGELEPTGHVPACVAEFVAAGIPADADGRYL